jgi:AraC family transcriptional regulator
MGVGDPIVGQVMQSLGAAARDRMPDSYADSAARYLATHLLSTAHRWPESTVSRHPGELTDRRLARVMEYLEHHHREDVSNQQMAEVAGISPFHFTRLFKRKVGCTPHRYVLQLRMQSARKMLRGTDLSVLEVAAACGYANPSHFAAAFCNAFGQNPGEFRGSLS